MIGNQTQFVKPTRLVSQIVAQQLVSSDPLDHRSDSEELAKLEVRVEPFNGEMPVVEACLDRRLNGHDAAWVSAVSLGLRQRAYLISALVGGRVAGVLPLCLVNGPLFGKFLVSLPYLNTGGVWAQNDRVATRLIDAACDLSDRLDVKYLELRHEGKFKHSKISFEREDKVHMRMELPNSSEELLARFKSKLRSQVKRSWQFGHVAEYGGIEFLGDFYNVFTTNMRDLGTPVFPKRLFAEVINAFDGRAEFCIVRSEGRPVGGALIVHANGFTEVPSASCLRIFNKTNANMFMYWHLFERAIEKGSSHFDFGRSSKNSGTHRFKAQWGAEEYPATWQYYVRNGDPTEMRADASSKQRMIKIWQRLPVWVTKLIGPPIGRGIP